MIAFRGLWAFFIWFIARYTPSSSAVRPFACVKVRRFWISSVLVVNPHDELRPVVELNQEKLVFRIRGFEKLGGGLARFRQLASHAAAGVEHEPDAERERLRSKTG